MQRLRHRDRADEVHVERREPVGARRGEPLVEVGAGEIDERIDAAEARDDVVHERRDLVVVRDVGAPEERPLAELGGERLPGPIVDVRDRDGHPVPVQLAHDGLPDQRRAAGDDRRPACQALHRLPPATRWLQHHSTTFVRPLPCGARMEPPRRNRAPRTSSEPRTLARDARRLRAHGQRPAHGRGVDAARRGGPGDGSAQCRSGARARRRAARRRVHRAGRAPRGGRGPGRQRVVGDFMTRDPETIEPDDTTEHAAVLMIHGGFRHLPVVDEGQGGRDPLDPRPDAIGARRRRAARRLARVLLASHGRSR